MTDREAMQQAQLEKLDGTLWMLNQELTRKQVEIDALQKLMRQALEALTVYDGTNGESKRKRVLTALRERLAQPEFIKHEEGGDGWSDWVCPDPDDYLIKCCDCGLVHEAQFRVVKYKPGATEDCEGVNDPNLQAVFRMRRSQRWTPDDTAYRPGGLAQPQQWEQFYPDIGNPFKVRSCAECGKSGGWALYCVECMEKLIAVAEREPLLDALTAICVKCRSNEWGPTTPRKEILNWMHDHASVAIAKLKEKNAVCK